MKKSKYSRNKKITKRKGTMKYRQCRQYRQYRQYGGENDDKKGKKDEFDKLTKEMEDAQTVLSTHLTELLKGRSELINNTQSIDSDKLNNLNEQYTNSVKLMEEKKHALDKQTNEILNHLMDEMRVIKDIHSNNHSTTTNIPEDEDPVDYSS